MKTPFLPNTPIILILNHPADPLRLGLIIGLQHFATKSINNVLLGTWGWGFDPELLVGLLAFLGAEDSTAIVGVLDSQVQGV